ncbi:retrovirus-related pol polyprotein from transposon TNT 1-94, partial [Tanacetum coccineum]
MLTKPQFFYDNTTKQALGFQNPFYLQKAQQSKPKLYVGDIIVKTNPIVIPDSEETLALAEESRSKMLLKHKDNMMLEKEKQNSVNSSEPTLSIRPTNVEVPKELPKVSMVNTSLKKLKHHLANFDVVVKERTTPTAITEGVKQSTSASGSQPSGNTKKDKIQQTPSSTLKNKVEAHPRKVKSSLKNKDCVVAPKGTAHVQHSKLNANYELKCVKCNGCMLSDNHDLCVLDFINNVNARAKSRSVKKNSKRKVWKPTGKVFTNIGYIWRPTGRTFTIVGNACPLTRITTTTEVPLRKSSALDNKTPKPVVTLVYSRKPRKSKTSVPVNNYKVIKSVTANNSEPSQSWGSIVSNVLQVIQIVLWYLDSGCSKHMTGDRSQLTNFVNKFLGTVKFGNDHVVKIMGYGDYQIGNVTISRVYYVEGLGTDNGTEFVNQTLREYYEKVGISHETSVARSPQQNGVVERRNRTLIEAARTMLIYAKAPLFLWAKAVATAWHPSVDFPATQEVIAPIDEVVAPEPAVSTSTPSSTTVDQDAPSPSNSQTTPETEPPIIPNDVEEDNHDIEVAHMGSDPYFGVPIPEIPSYQSLSSGFIHTIVHSDHQISKHKSKWTKDHPLENIIGELTRPVSTWLQLHEQALFCYYDAFLTAVEPKTYKDALTQAYWIEAMQEELNELERLKVWELIPRPDKVMVITLKWIYKVKLYELAGILKNKARLVARGYRQEEGIDFEESF